jgi:CRP-like cAMP-binding protein
LPAAITFNHGSKTVDKEASGKLYKDGDIILEEGSHGREMYIIQSGKVVVSKGSAHGERVVAELCEGEVFGELSILDERPRSATVKAVGETRVTAIDKDAFLKWLKKDPGLALTVMHRMAGKMRRLDTRLALALDKIDSARAVLSHDRDILGLRGIL